MLPLGCTMILCRSWKGHLGRMIRLHISIHSRCPWTEKANPFHLCAWLTHESWSTLGWLHLGPLLFMCPFNFNAWPPIAARRCGQGKLSRFKEAIDENFFWHLFRVLSHFSMDQCPPPINFTWVGSKSHQSLRGYGCLLLESFGTSPLYIIGQSMSKQHMLSSNPSSLYCSSPSASKGLWLMIFTIVVEARAGDLSSNRSNTH